VQVSKSKKKVKILGSTWNLRGIRRIENRGFFQKLSVKRDQILLDYRRL
jgi:hypothetical protein